METLSIFNLWINEFKFRRHLLNPDTLEEKFILLDEDVA